MTVAFAAVTGLPCHAPNQYGSLMLYNGVGDNVPHFFQ